MKTGHNFSLWGTQIILLKNVCLCNYFKQKQLFSAGVGPETQTSGSAGPLGKHDYPLKAD